MKFTTVMLKKPQLFLSLTGIAIGLLIGILDSWLHYSNFESSKLLNIISFVLFFATVFWSIVFLRDRFNNGLLSYFESFIDITFTGSIAAFTIATIRYVYLNYVISINIDPILAQTKETMLNKYSLYTTEQISNRLSFIEFSYNPLISSLLYFIYYLTFVIIFAFFASFIIKRIDRNISI